MNNIPFLTGSATCCICGRKITFDPQKESNWTRIGDSESDAAVFICDLDMAKLDPMSHRYKRNVEKALRKLTEMIK